MKALTISMPVTAAILAGACNTTEQRVGEATVGAGTGAAVGGPVGAVVGGAAGAVAARQRSCRRSGARRDAAEEAVTPRNLRADVARPQLPPAAASSARHERPSPRRGVMRHKRNLGRRPKAVLHRGSRVRAGINKYRLFGGRLEPFNTGSNAWKVSCMLPAVT